MSDPGTPSLHQLGAAVHVCLVAGGQTVESSQLDRSFQLTATGAKFPVEDLVDGKSLLVNLGLAIEREGYFTVTAGLESLVRTSESDAAAHILASAIGRLLDLDPARALLERDELLGKVQRASDEDVYQKAFDQIKGKFDQQHRNLVGAIGEEVVLAAVVAELLSLGVPGLVREARRVSLYSDSLGYDIFAPRVGRAEGRLLEVKTTSSDYGDPRVHLTRNEARVGTANDTWSLVVCRLDSAEARTATILGWCPITTIVQSLPSDNGKGRWDSVGLVVPGAQLSPGLPPAAV
jgi:hypothetical protein